MDLFSPGKPRVGYKDKRPRQVKPMRPSPQHPLPVNAHQYPPPTNQSTVSLTTPTSMHSMPPNWPPHQLQTWPHPNHSIVQQHNWVSTANLPIFASATSSDNDVHSFTEQSNSCDVISEKLSEIISRIDEETYSESSQELEISIPQTSPPTYSRTSSFPLSQDEGRDRSLQPYRKPAQAQQRPLNRSINVLTKLSYYSNSRLPASLPPFRAYIPTYPLLCLAALCSTNAYQNSAARNEQLVSADARIGSKAMVIKSVTCADERTIVFAIRGTSVLSLRDWNVNLHTTPESPAGFLDDDGNYCHAGFLRVAKAMVKPIAARLRHLLEENPNRLSYSLLITGHSAGGAIASLLYAHMLSEHVRSELTILSDCFKRVHCVTFGAPPISLLPLKKPAGREKQMQKCMFHSFMNEGDPVVRAEKSYIMSLVDLLATTPSSKSSLLPNSSQSRPQTRPSDLCTASASVLKVTNLGLFTASKKPKPRLSQQHMSESKPTPTWAVPQGTLSNAGRLVVLRGPESPSRPGHSQSQLDLRREFEEVRAYTVTDEQIRQVIFGDPHMHAMEVYRRRIEALAMKAATGRDKYY